MILASKITLLVLAVFFALASIGTTKDKPYSYLYGGMAIAFFVLLLVFLKFI